MPVAAGKIQVELTEIPKDTPRQVLEAFEDFKEFLERFDIKAREYGEGSFFELGVKGQFSDIYRKIIKLRTALWDGKPEQLTTEGVEEVINDLMGHLFMTLQCIRYEEAKKAKPALGSRVPWRGSPYEKGDYFRVVSGNYENLLVSIDAVLDRRDGVEQAYVVSTPSSAPFIVHHSEIHRAMVGSGEPDNRVYAHPVGSRVIVLDKYDNGDFNGKIGTIVGHDRASAGFYYKVKFAATGIGGARETTLTMREDTIEFAPRAVGDNPQA